MMLQYWYALPLAGVIAAVATASGVGGATFGVPLFVLGLGIPPEIAIGVALVTGVFGFASGVLVYARSRLIDYRLGKALLLTTVPAALVGAWISGLIEPNVLKAVLGVGLFAVAVSSLRSPAPARVAQLDEAVQRAQRADRAAETCLITSDGEEICYTVCNRMEGRLIAMVGALFKGMIATGLGEMDDHFLLERCHVASKVSVATGVFVILFTTLSASAGHVVRFALRGGRELSTALSLLVFSVPGVIVGGRLGPLLTSRIPRQLFERGLHILLLLVAALTLVEAFL